MMKNQLLQNKEWLETKYVSDHLSSTRIGELCGVTRQTVLSALREHGIAIRNRTSKLAPYNDFFEVIDTEEKAYWLGFITADGNIHKTNPTLQINLSQQDKNHLEKFCVLIRRDIKPLKVAGDISKMCYTFLSSTKMKIDLANKGVVPAKTDIDQSPIFNNVPEYLRCHFIRGLFDGDGSLALMQKKTLFIFSIAGEINLLKTVKAYIQNEVGINDTQLDEYHRYAVIRWGGKTQVTAICKWLYDDCSVYLERKRASFNTILRRKSKARFHGVARTPGGKWNSFIWIENKRIHLGNYNSEMDAAKRYDIEAKKSGMPRYKYNFVNT